MFSNSGYKVNKSTDLMDDPLAGCLYFMQEEGNAKNFLGSVLLRLRLFYTEDVCNKLADTLIDQSDHVQISRWEFVINETLYEFRKAQKSFDTMKEAVTLNDWATDLMLRYHEDMVLDFVGVVKRGRAVRMLIFK